MKKLIFVVFLLVGCGVAGNQGYAWYNSSVYQPMSSRSQPVAFHIDPGEGTDAIAQDLYSKGLIRNADVFLVYVKYGSQHPTLEAGDFTLNKNMSMVDIINALGRAKVQQLSITVTEGQPAAQMAQKAAAAGLGTTDEYLAAASDPGWQSQYDFLQSRPASVKSLEGFLFPDTYQLDRGATAKDLVKRQLDEFGQQLTPALRQQAGQGTAVRPAESIWNIVVLASIVEREVTKDPDRAIVCGIFYNRLKINMALQDDVTVLYGLHKLQGPLTDADKKQDTPYNTYLHTGLPAGPISNPGIASISACVNPQSTNNMYFFADAQGITRYARTSVEFNAAIAKYGLAPGG